MSSPKKNEWYLYIIRTYNNALYTGITTDVKRRFNEHVLQGAKCAKFLKGKAPLTLVYFDYIGTRQDALKWEYFVKKLSKKQKEDIILGKLSLAGTE